MFANILLGIQTVFTPAHILILAGSVILGLISGAIPGISGVMTIILLMPITFGLGPIPAFLIMTAIYSASTYAGSISAVMFRTPGSPEAVMTILDGYKMTEQGKMNEAISTAVFASSIGGIIGAIFLTLLAPQLAEWSFYFSEAEYFALAIFGLTLITSIGSKNLTKALMSMCIGMFIAVIGLDPVSGISRYTFNIQSMRGGISLIPLVLGIFAISEMLRQISQGAKLPKKRKANKKFTMSIFPPFHFFKKFGSILGINSLLGTFIGILPGIGGTTGSIFGYSFAQKYSKNGDKFGTGIPEGIAAPEVANNAASAGALVPLFALGIPGSVTTAVMFGAFIMHGIQPGPLLFEQQPRFVYTIFIGLFIVNILVLLLNKGFVRVFSYILKIPYPLLISIIITICMIAAFSTRNNIFDMVLMLVFGIIAYLLEELNYPLAPMVLGVVLGGIAEPSFRRALALGDNNIMYFFQRPISAFLIICSILVIMYAIYTNIKVNYEK